MPKRFAIATGTRADWGLLRPLAVELQQRGCEISVIATNMHLRPEYGNTVSEIEADGFAPLRVETSGTRAQIMADVIRGFSDLFESLRPDAVIILGDRFEMLAVASAAMATELPIVHIAGGAVSAGAVDDSIRHSITKLSALHLVETEEYRHRVIQLGEQPERVVTTGAIGLHNLLGTPLMQREELEESLGFKIPPGTILATLHDATLDTVSFPERMEAFCRALADYPVLFTYPNNDTDPTEAIAIMRDYQQKSEGRWHIIPSLGRLRYLSALQYVSLVAGNSSSGLVEVPSAGIPTLDIGIRQEGRTAGKSVVHCGASFEEIINGLKTALSQDMAATASKRENPYYKPDTLRLMADTILNADFNSLRVKHFHDII